MDTNQGNGFILGLKKERWRILPLLYTN